MRRAIGLAMRLPVRLSIYQSVRLSYMCIVCVRIDRAYSICRSVHLGYPWGTRGYPLEVSVIYEYICHPSTHRYISTPVFHRANYIPMHRLTE